MSPTIETLKEAAREITRLRRHNEILTAKAEVIEIFGQALRAGQQNYGTPMGIDIVWSLNKEADRLTQEEAKMPVCPNCGSNDRVSLSPPESADRGKYFCPCNEPCTKPSGSGHFDLPARANDGGAL